MAVVPETESTQTSAVSSSVALAYFNRYQQAIAGILESNSLQFDEQTIADMRAYGTDEPSIFYAGNQSGRFFYGLMTSPESYNIIRQGIVENVDAEEQPRQLEILDLLKTDSERMVREFPRAMDGPIADAQALHVAFVRTVNPEGAEQALADVDSNQEIVDSLATGIERSMTEVELAENFTAPVAEDPTIVVPDVDTAPAVSTETVAVTVTDEADAQPVVEPETTSAIPAENTAPVTNFSDAGVLLNGEASDDMAYLANLVEEAREMGVDTALIDSIESQIAMTGDQTKFVTTAAATEAVSVYADALDRALADGVVGRDEYGQALSGLFTSIAAGGIVTDRAGMADDIAAAPGLKDEAQANLRRVFEASVANREPRMETSLPAASVETRQGMALTNG